MCVVVHACKCVRAYICAYAYRGPLTEPEAHHFDYAGLLARSQDLTISVPQFWGYCKQSMLLFMGGDARDLHAGRQVCTESYLTHCALCQAQALPLHLIVRMHMQLCMCNCTCVCAVSPLCNMVMVQALSLSRVWVHCPTLHQVSASSISYCMISGVSASSSLG